MYPIYISYYDIPLVTTISGVIRLYLIPLWWYTTMVLYPMIFRWLEVSTIYKAMSSHKLPGIIHIYIYIHITYLYTYIYIYILVNNTYIYLYIYIYCIYIIIPFLLTILLGDLYPRWSSPPASMPRFCSAAFVKAPSSLRHLGNRRVTPGWRGKRARPEPKKTGNWGEMVIYWGKNWIFLGNFYDFVT